MSIDEKLEQEHGDLHNLIPPLVSEVGQEETARILDVKQAWVSRWLRTNGYVRVTRYEREGEKAS